MGSHQRQLAEEGDRHNADYSAAVLHDRSTFVQRRGQDELIVSSHSSGTQWLAGDLPRLVAADSRCARRCVSAYIGMLFVQRRQHQPQTAAIVTEPVVQGHAQDTKGERRRNI